MTIAGEEHSGALCLLGPSEYLFHQNWLRWNCIQMNWLINAEPSSNVASGLAWKFTSGIHHWSNWWAKLCKLSSVWLRLDLEDQLCWRLVAWWMVAPWRSMEVMPGCLVATAMYCSVALLSGGKCSKCLRPGQPGNYIWHNTYTKLWAATVSLFLRSENTFINVHFNVNVLVCFKKLAAACIHPAVAVCVCLLWFIMM